MAAWIVVAMVVSIVLGGMLRRRGAELPHVHPEEIIRGIPAQRQATEDEWSDSRIGREHR
ncbi:hypothetical protein [Pseudonocardia sp. TRM90224]|uniref:hypothetical protein n=1 Tax=Pseudonocardia sp. TRM90224 TaxID=2812678 RepID=UPI001E52C9AF|nr:hypothetical protein [Pseudonocardia sp. TRM90224]